MANHLAKGEKWSSGYQTVAWIPDWIGLILILSFPFWDQNQAVQTRRKKQFRQPSGAFIYYSRTEKQALLVFFCYCTIEAEHSDFGEPGFNGYLKKVLIPIRPPNSRSELLSLLGIHDLADFFSGFLTSHFTNRQFGVTLGQGVIRNSGLIALFAFSISRLFQLAAVGLRAARRSFPSLLHETP